MKNVKFYYAKLAKLKNRELSGFLNNITKSTGRLPENETLSIITENLHKYTQALADALAAEDTKSRTEQMHVIDSQLINSWNAMRLILKGLAVDSEIKTEASQVLYLVSQIGDPRYANIKAKSSIINNVLQILDAIGTENLQKFGIAYHFNTIKNAYDQYADAEIERMDYRNANRQKVAVARQNATFAYYSLANFVRTMLAYTDVSEYAVFAERVNQAVKETYKRNAAAETSPSESDNETVIEQ